MSNNDLVILVMDFMIILISLRLGWKYGWDARDQLGGGLIRRDGEKGDE